MQILFEDVAHRFGIRVTSVLPNDALSPSRVELGFQGVGTILFNDDVKGVTPSTKFYDLKFSGLGGKKGGADRIHTFHPATSVFVALVDVHYLKNPALQWDNFGVIEPD